MNDNLKGFTAYSYIRFSTKKQGLEGKDSFRRQYESAKKKLSALGCDFNEDLVLDDSAISSFRAKNLHFGALAEFIKLSNQGKLGPKPLLVIEHLDRFSRAGIKEALPKFMDLLSSGVTVYSGIDGIIYRPGDEDDLGKMMMALVGFAAANDFSAKLSERIKEHKAEVQSNVAQGKIVNIGSFKPSWLEWDDTKKKYVTNDFFPIAKRIIKEYLNGASAHKIAGYLQLEKVPCMSHGKSWSAGMIVSLLRSTSIKGIWGGKPLFGIQLVDDKQYSIIQGILASRKMVKGNKSPFINIFGRLLVCEHCKGRINLSCNTSHGKKNYYYRCCNWTKKACDARRQANGYSFEFHILGYIDIHPQDMIPTDTTKASTLIEEMQTKELALTRRISKLIDVDEDVPELKSKIASLKLERNDIRMALEVAKGQLMTAGNPVQSMKFLKANLIDTPELIDEALIDTKKREEIAKILPLFIKEIRVSFQDRTFQVVSKAGKVGEWFLYWEKGLPTRYPTREEIKTSTKNRESIESFKITEEEEQYLKTL